MFIHSNRCKFYSIFRFTNIGKEKHSSSRIPASPSGPRFGVTLLSWPTTQCCELVLTQGPCLCRSSWPSPLFSLSEPKFFCQPCSLLSPVSLHPLGRVFSHFPAVPRPPGLLRAPLQRLETMCGRSVRDHVKSAFPPCKHISRMPVDFVIINFSQSIHHKKRLSLLPHKKLFPLRYL